MQKKKKNVKKRRLTVGLANKSMYNNGVIAKLISIFANMQEKRREISLALI